VQLVQKLVDDGDGKCILDCDGVECPVVYAETPRATSFLDKQYRRREGKEATSNQPLVQHGRALPIQLVLVGSRVPVRPDRDRRRPREKGDGVIPGSRWWHASGLGEDASELSQERRQKICIVARLEAGAGRSRYAPPAYLAALVLNRHGQCAEIP